MPASNRIYWQAKIARNAKRDKQTARKLNAQGWHYVNIWECDVVRGIARALLKLEALKQNERRR